jgi:hypothetical protein
MNPIDSCLQRLFRAAAADPAPLPSEAPFALEARVLADWRIGAPAETWSALPLVRRACVCACAILILAAALTLHSHTEAPPNELVIVDSAIQLTMMQ